MEDKLRVYESDDIKVSWSKTRCIHFQACVRGLHDVFNVEQKPWIQPQNASAEEVLEVVLRCPTGALHAERKDGEPTQSAPSENVVNVAPDGPLYFHGDIHIKDATGETVLEDTRVALCRCGASEHKPFCDGSHSEADFKDSGAMAPNKLKTKESSESLTVILAKDGPLRLDGAVELKTVGNLTSYKGSGGALCRCGASNHKPFCDGSHRDINFKS